MFNRGAMVITDDTQSHFPNYVVFESFTILGETVYTILICQRIDKLKFYRHCPPIRVNVINMTELEKCDCVSSVMTIAPLLNIDREKWVLCVFCR